MLWIQSPNVGINTFAGDYSLAADGYSTFDLIFCDRPDTISSVGKLVVTIRFHIGRINGEFSFVTDQSCLRLLANDLNMAISEITT